MVLAACRLVASEAEAHFQTTRARRERAARFNASLCSDRDQALVCSLGPGPLRGRLRENFALSAAMMLRECGKVASSALSLFGQVIGWDRGRPARFR